MNDETVEQAKKLMASVKSSGLMAALAQHMADAVAALEAVGFNREEAIKIVTSDQFKVSS